MHCQNCQMAPQQDWFITALPFITLALGSGLTMASQALSDRRTWVRESLARRDQLVIELYQQDREVLQVIQKIVMDMHRFLHEINAPHRAPGLDRAQKLISVLTVEQAERSNNLYTSGVPVFFRCRSATVQVALRSYTDGYQSLMESTTRGQLLDRYQELNEPFRALQRAIGRELQRSPLDDLHRKTSRFSIRMAARRRPELDTEPVDNS